MTKQEFQEMYTSEILPHSKNPYHFHIPNTLAAQTEAYNPLCGDKYTLYFDPQANGIQHLHFTGFGCAVSKASTSLLLKHIDGLSVSASQQLIKLFLKCVDGDDKVQLESKELQLLTELRKFNGRLDCVKLSWLAMLEQLSTEV